MKIATKTGDDGFSKLMFGSRKPKNNAAFHVLGDIDETSALMGLAKSKLRNSYKNFAESHICFIEDLQKNLFNLMGELNCDTADDVKKYIKSFDALTEADMQNLDGWVDFLQNLPELEMKDWVLYGKSETGAILDVASKVCRRAERSLIALNQERKGLHRELLGRFINRLSDYLFLLARLIDYQMEPTNVS